MGILVVLVVLAFIAYWEWLHGGKHWRALWRSISGSK
jgi:hypothetical protein